MSEVTLAAELRPAVGSATSGRERRGGQVPAVVYGLGEPNAHVTVDAHELALILSSETGANTLISLAVDGNEQLALARQIQRHPVKGGVLHVDFIRVRADEEVAAEIPIHVVGEALGVRNGGVLEQGLFTIAVMARPADLPPAIEIDVTELDVGNQIRVADVTPPPGVTITTDPEERLASITVPSEIEEEEVVPEEGEEIEGELAEGEEAPAAEAPAEEAAEGGTEE